ncbi:hypothetical protein GCM10020255_108950 [Rhodococcus baikonurensis]
MGITPTSIPSLDGLAAERQAYDSRWTGRGHPHPERRTIDVVPDAERHGTPRSQFTLWFGANMQITAIVDGALAVVFGADAIWAIVGLLIGNIFGGAVMALHSAQGPRMGLPR